MAIGYEELTVYFKLVGVVLGIWALILVIRGINSFSSRTEKRNWVLVLYAVFMFFLAKVFDGLSIIFEESINARYLEVMSMLVEGIFFIMIFYVVYLEIKSSGKLFFFDLKAKPEAERGELPRKVMKEGRAYLVEREDPKEIYEIFHEMVNHGYEGLIFTREFPGRVREKFHFKETPIIWLTREGTESSIRPNELERMNHAVQDFLKKSNKGLILIDGFEYLSTYNGFGKLIKLIHDIRDSVALKNAILILIVHPRSMSEREISYLRKDLKRYRED